MNNFKEKMLVSERRVTSYTNILLNLFLPYFVWFYLRTLLANRAILMKMDGSLNSKSNEYKYRLFHREASTRIHLSLELNVWQSNKRTSEDGTVQSIHFFKWCAVNLHPIKYLNISITLPCLFYNSIFFTKTIFLSYIFY